jgi:hypothetical protein
MPVPYAPRVAVRCASRALVSVLLLVVGLACALAKEELSARVSAFLARLLPTARRSAPAPANGPGPTCAPTAALHPSQALARRPVLSLNLEGLWHPSGWMGDADGPEGPLRHRFVQEDTDDLAGAEEWSYHPSRGALGWVAAAYQYPDSNWGSRPGRDLSRHGLTRLTLFCRGKAGGERVLFKSGGHTQPGAAYPASYEVSSGVVTLTRKWRMVTLALPEGTDMSNTATALAFVIERRWAPTGPVVFYLRGASFRGPEE